MFRRFLLASVASNFRRFGNIFTRFKNLLVQEEDSGNANVFYNPQDLTSLRVGTNGFGGNPTVGDPVGMMLDTSGLSVSMEEFLSSQPELVTNGTFDTDPTVDWNEQDGNIDLTTVAGELQMTHNTGSTYSWQSFSTQADTWYLITGYGRAGTNVVNTFVQARDGVNGAYINISPGVTDGEMSLAFKAVSGTSTVRIGATLSGTFPAYSFFDNISVKEIPGYHAVAPTDAARPTLMDDPDTTWASLTDDGTRGEELVTNGGFDGNVTGWQASGSATVSYNSGEDAAEIDVTGSGAGIQDDQTITVEPGSEYEVTAVVKSGTYVGDINYAIGGVNTVFSLTGDYVSQTRTITATTNDLLVQLSRATATTGTWYVQSISVRKVNTAFDGRGDDYVVNGGFDTNSDWTASGDSTISGGVLNVADGVINEDIRNTGATAFPQDKTAEVVFTISESTANIGVRVALYHVGGSIQAYAEGGAYYTANGTYRLILPAGLSAQNYYIGFRRISAHTGTLKIDNVSLREVLTPNLLLTSAGDDDSTFDTDTGNWAKSAGWSIGSGVASASSAPNDSDLYKLVDFEQNKFYKLQMYISSISAGALKFRIGGTVFSDTFSTVGWHSVIVRSLSGTTNFGIRASGVTTATIDNVIIQELPSTTPTSYYLDVDGVDDWMQVTPTLNLGEQWWHTGAWQVNSGAALNIRAFATSTYSGASLRMDQGGSIQWFDGSGAWAVISSSDPATKHVVTVEQSDTNSLSARYNGVQSVDPIIPYDDTAVAQGLALFSQRNDTWGSGFDGRFYGGAWGQGQVDYDELTTLQDYLGTLVEPDIDPTDVTSYDNVYEMLSAQTAAALFDIDDTTSLRTIDAGLQTYRVPVDGDPVNLMADVSKAGGLPFDAAQKTVVATLANWSGGSGVDNNEWTQTGQYTGGALYVDFSATAGYYKGTIEYEILSGQDWSFFIRGSGASPQSPYEPDLHFNLTSGGRKTVTFERLWDGSGTALQTFLEPRSPTGPFGTIRVYSMTLEHIPGYVATAPSDAARPTLASVLDETASELTDDGTRGPELVTNGGFDTDSDWTTPGGWSISGGVATNDGTTSSIYQTVPVSPGDQYEITFTVVSISAGSFRLNMGFGILGTARTSPGTYTEILPVGDGLLRILATAGIGSIDNISVKKVQTVFDGRGDELVTNGDFSGGTTGWSGSAATISVIDGELEVVPSASTYGAWQNVTVQSGKTYEVTLDARAGTGSPWIRLGNTGILSSQYVLDSSGTTGSRKYIIVTTGTQLYISLGVTGTSTTGYFDNISVKEVLTPNLLLTAAGDDDSTFDTQGNWTFSGSNWAIGSGVATATPGSGAGYIVRAGTFSPLKWYKVSVYVSAHAGGVGGFVDAFYEGNTQTAGYNFNSVGWHTVYIRPKSTVTALNFYGGITYDASVDNFIVQEVPASVARAHYLDFDGSDDNLILDGTDFGSSTNATLYKTFRGDTADTQQIMFGTIAGPYILAAESGAVGNTALTGSVGSPVFREDGAIASYANRDVLFTALVDSTDHTIGVEEIDLSGSGLWASNGFYIGGEYSSTWDSTGRLYSWAAVDTRLDGRNRDLLENFMLSKKTS